MTSPIRTVIPSYAELPDILMWSSEIDPERTVIMACRSKIRTLGYGYLVALEGAPAPRPIGTANNVREYVF